MEEFIATARKDGEVHQLAPLVRQAKQSSRSPEVPHPRFDSNDRTQTRQPGHRPDIPIDTHPCGPVGFGRLSRRRSRQCRFFLPCSQPMVTPLACRIFAPGEACGAHHDNSREETRGDAGYLQGSPASAAGAELFHAWFTREPLRSLVPGGGLQAGITFRAKTGFCLQISWSHSDS